MDYLPEIISKIEFFINNYGLLGVFLGSIIEELIAPLPSSLIQTLGGLLVMNNSVFNFINILKLILFVSVPSSVGVIIGSYIYYFLAKKLGIVFIQRWGKYLGFTINDLHKIEKKLENSKWDELAFVGMRSLPISPSIAIAFYAGITEMNSWKYIKLSFWGSLIRSTFLGGVGWLLSSQVENIIDWFSYLEKFGLLIILLLIIIILIYKNRKKLFFSKI